MTLPRPGILYQKELQAEAAVWRDKIKVISQRQDTMNWYFTVKVTGPAKPPDDVIFFVCDRQNWGGRIESKHKDDENTSTYSVVTYKD